MGPLPLRGYEKEARAATRPQDRTAQHHGSTRPEHGRDPRQEFRRSGQPVQLRGDHGQARQGGHRLDREPEPESGPLVARAPQPQGGTPAGGAVSSGMTTGEVVGIAGLAASGAAAGFAILAYNEAQNAVNEARAACKALSPSATCP